MNLKELNKKQLLKLIQAYDIYIYNDGEPWDENRQPVCINEFFDLDFQEV